MQDRRLIEDYLPIEEISAEASREKTPRKDHISALHRWWARRPLVACRAAVYGALMPAPSTKKEREQEAAFVKQLCKYPGSPATIAEARRRIAEAHRKRTGSTEPPKVLDMFAGGGAIPLEALRLGCEAFALDLNPVAYIIELCTLFYPQQFGRPDPTQKGSAEDGTWAGLSKEVEYWGNRFLEAVRGKLAWAYPEIPDPRGSVAQPGSLWQKGKQTRPATLVPTAYLWTRTVRCKNPSCGATVPLVRQTWLAKKARRYVALKMVVPRDEKAVRFQVVEATTEKGLGFDPSVGSEGGNATCPFCSTVADDEYVRQQGMAGQVGAQLMCVVCARPGGKHKVYLSADEAPGCVPTEEALRTKLEEICKSSGLTVPDEPINPLRPSPWTRGASGPTRHGLTTWGSLFTTRQLLYLISFAATLREIEEVARQRNYADSHLRAVLTYLALLVDRQALYNSTLCRWHNTHESVADTYGRQALPMVWDYAELSIAPEGSASPEKVLDSFTEIIKAQQATGNPARVVRGTATSLIWPAASFDAVITDPPYYDNVPYADISDFFFVWLKRTIGHLYPEHFATPLTPKSSEVTALASRHGGDMRAATAEYEGRMLKAFEEAHRVLKPEGILVIVYAHKTTLGWATLVDAIRRTGLNVTEAWPLETETSTRLLAMESAALGSSIFLVARKRSTSGTGLYEEHVRPALETIVRERVNTLWELGISGADLVIACVGAGLSAFTRYERVEYANGEEVPAERFLAEVETVVLEQILAKLSKAAGSQGSQYDLGGLDPTSRFYLLWRYTYGTRVLDSGEAIIFANGTHVELDGPEGLSSGPRPLLAKKSGTYRLRDFNERGPDEKLGLPADDGQPAPVVDALQRLLWLMEYRPAGIPDFIQQARPNLEQVRLVAQALAGPALKGGELRNLSPASEVAALGRLTANWRSLFEETLFGTQPR